MSEAQPTALAANAVRSAALSETAMDASVSRRSEVLAMFENFRQILDEHNDRYERLVKISRDLTIQSKRVIFLLHRVASGQTTPTAAASARDPPARPASALGQTSDADTNARGYHDQDCARDGDANVQVEDPARTAELNAAAQARQKFDDLKPLFGKIVAELEGQEADRYSRALSPGLQEFLEALSFAHYFEHGTLITYTEVSKFLDPIPLSIEDYLLGVSDLSGELMRYAISAASMISARKHKVIEVCHFVRFCSAGWEPLTPYIRGLAKKQEVTNESLKKIEKAAYAIAIRSTEYPDVELQNIFLDFMQEDGADRPRKRGHARDDDDDDVEEF